MLEEALEGGGGGGDTKDAMSLCAAGSFNSGVANAHVVKGSVNPRCDALRLIRFELEPHVMGELKGAVVHGCHGGRLGGGLLFVGLGVWLSLDYLPALWGWGGGNGGKGPEWALEWRRGRPRRPS